MQLLLVTQNWSTEHSTRKKTSELLGLVVTTFPHFSLPLKVNWSLFHSFGQVRYMRSCFDSQYLGLCSVGDFCSHEIGSVRCMLRRLCVVFEAWMVHFNTNMHFIYSVVLPGRRLFSFMAFVVVAVPTGHQNRTLTLADIALVAWKTPKRHLTPFSFEGFVFVQRQKILDT